MSFLLSCLEDHGYELVYKHQLFTESGETGNSIPWQHLVRDVAGWLQKQYGSDVPLNPEEFRRGMVASMNDTIMAMTVARRLIMSRNRVGLGPAGAQVGDELCLLRGGRTPFVIRSTGNKDTIGRPMYELIGDCYVQGLMDREAVDENKARHECEQIILV
ncbi:MAG: hypothetical protein EOO38_19060 [Cytophagaceae bacterium]|nr:MAG: hypothetical protein EOO38_19060 [Cytophagaceae bacterium]